MPWITNSNGEEEYVVSKYKKEQLPTWHEIYYDFYLNKWYSYDPNDEKQKANDPYYKIPKALAVMFLVANQFNKMLTEDGEMENAIAYFNNIEQSIFIDCKCMMHKDTKRESELDFIFTDKNGQTKSLTPTDEHYQGLVDVILKRVIEYFVKVDSGNYSAKTGTMKKTDPCPI